MNYLLDKKTKKQKFIKWTLFVVFLVIVFYFRMGIWSGLSYASHRVFRPVLTGGSNLGDNLSKINLLFTSKNSLEEENENLKIKLNEQEARMANYNSMLDENLKIKEILGRLPPARAGGAQAGKNPRNNMILAAILAKPNQSLYDTLIIDAGSKEGIEEGNIVFALGNVPIGRVAEVYERSAKVILFSNSKEKTQVIISGRDVSTEVIGRGGGNFEMVMPKDFTLSKGDQVVLPGIVPYVVATVETILYDPRDSFAKVLLSSPVNVRELKFVEIEKN